MDHRQFDLVRESLTGSGSALLLAADLFHRRLFFLAPGLEACFPADARARNAAFLTFVRATVADLDRLERLLPRLCALARALDRAGVTAAHYDAVRAALLFALRMAMLEDLSFPVRTAWRRTFDLLAGVMLRSLADAPAALPPYPPAPHRTPARSGTHRISVPPPSARTSSIPPSAQAAG
jgi:hemoglobin-like flavoprotein